MGRLGAIWGLGGVLAVLAYAVVRLAGIFLEALDYSFDWRHWAVLIVNTAFMAYTEGYRGFQQGYSPRVVARAATLIEAPTGLRVALAPLFCMGYFHTTRRRLISVYVLTFGIVMLILLFQLIPQPWRGILDAGVVLGLSWGMASILAFAAKAWLGPGLVHSPDLPGYD
ncbi:MAG: hypothetical protein AAF657_10785 [Acidobacteriota bacterium]